MNELQKMYPGLTIFSDIDWEAVSKEYEATSIEVSFPEYLQIKAQDGDCPHYLFEIAYYELAAFNAKSSTDPFPFRNGIYLNPTAHFLQLEYDIQRMLREAETGKIEVHERSHVLCLFRKTDDSMDSLELDQRSLSLLEHLENGPQLNHLFVPEELTEEFKRLKGKELILDLLRP